MKLKLTNLELQQQLLPGLYELRSLKANTRIQYNCLKSIKECEAAVKVIEEERKKILDESAVQENGKPKVDKNEYVFETPEKKAEIVAKINELFLLETEVEIWPVPFTEASQMEMTGELLNKLMGKFFTE